MTGKSENYRKTFLNYLRMLVLAAGGFHIGYYIACMNALGPPILQGVLGYDSKTEADQFNTVYGMVNFLYAMGGLFGSILGGKISDKYGRRVVFYLHVLIDAINIPIMVIAHTAPLLISRTLLGLATGLSACIYNIMLAELLPNKLCGIGGSLAVLFITLGIFFSALCQNIWEYQELVDYWRWFLLYPLLIELIRVTAFPFLFKTETPKFIFEHIEPASSSKLVSNKIVSSTEINISPLIAQSQPAEGNKKEGLVPEKLVEGEGEAIDRPINPQPDQADHKIDRIQETVPHQETTELTEMKRPRKDSCLIHERYEGLRTAYRHIYREEDVEHVILDMVSHWKAQQKEGVNKVGIKDLFSQKYRRQFILGCFLGPANPISGMSFFFFYSTVLFNEISGNGKIITLASNLTNIVTSLLSIALVAFIGRKPNIVGGSFLQVLGLLLLLIGYKTLDVNMIFASAIIYIVGFCLGVGGTALVYLGETLPPSGVGIALSLQWTMHGVVGLLVPIIVLKGGPMPLIIFFMIFCFIAGIYSLLFAVETRNKTSKQIFNEFNESWIHLCKKTQTVK